MTDLWHNFAFRLGDFHGHFTLYSLLIGFFMFEVVH